ncbi:hypothetical protein P154DRAFT_598363 [Amniculicola lignicola CBS 123094]|uniref:Uncharacterized protein n=1 Tax=Amniculicola lignicola CBS 123094 TaxID=1392246 RepID=A0A6A5WT55_9PLEO|nr:hypothetical protein P154DRAFT_598363 [Amniculicola lignicola CBS 123094]
MAVRRTPRRGCPWTAWASDQSTWVRMRVCAGSAEAEQRRLSTTPYLGPRHICPDDSIACVAGACRRTVEYCRFSNPAAAPLLTLTSSGPPELSNLLPSGAHFPDDTHDRHAHEPYTTSLQQRQQQAADFYRTQHSHSRVSSSSDSVGPSLRRTPNFDDPRPRPRARAASVDSGPQPQPQPQRAVRFADSTHLGERPSENRTSAYSRTSDTFAPHPALRISRRTASAIRFVLEEAIRTPYPFTPDLVEENASMADLTSGPGRAANGGARTAAGPVPVSQSDRSNIRTPQMIMNERRQRDARRQQAEADARAEEQRKIEEERRRSAERRAQAAGVAGTPTLSMADPAPQRPAAQAGHQRSDTVPYTSSSGAARPPERVVPPSGHGNPPAPSQPQDTLSGAQYGRPRQSSQTQPTAQPRPAPTYQPTAVPAGDPRRPPPPAQHARRPSATAGTSQAGPSSVPPLPPPPPGTSAGAQPRQSSSSTFPHAFERWETLSSHWEGLTSYWIRRLEQNTDEGRRDPLAQQMSRQITDLSAAGANLFHAVVELQRLRASSERKFQRWFYEHRQEQERAQEREAQLEHALRVERDARAEAIANMERMSTEKKNAERMVMEMKRELQISKEEARRAWEELGRREQEERDRTFSLREGQPTLVGGVQVVPMAGSGIGRHGSVSHRSQAGDDMYRATASSSQGLEQHYTYEEGQSPTDTDPFTEATRLRHEPDVSSLGQGTYIPAGAPVAPSASSSVARPTGAPPASSQPEAPAPLQVHRTTAGQQPSATETTSRPEAFYQQPAAYLHQDTATSIPEDERSYVTSQGEDITSEGEEEWAIDDYGNYILDESGRRVPYRALRQRDSDEYDVEEDRRRELEHLQHYGTAAGGTSSYTTTTNGGPAYQPTHPTTSAPDYSGSGYGDEWTNMRHHHPTRLSDVLEEDEKSRTSPSRASQASRNLY